MARRTSSPSDITGFDEGGSGASKMRDFGFRGSIEGAPRNAPGTHMMPPSPMPKADYSVTRDRHAYDKSGKRMAFPSGENNTTYYQADPSDFPEGEFDRKKVRGAPMRGPKIEERTSEGSVFSRANKVDLNAYAKGGAVRGGDIAQDKALVKKGIRQHETQEHGGKYSDLELRRGGKIGKAKLSVKPRRSRISKPSGPKMADGMGGVAAPVNRPPRDPSVSRSPKNAMPGGVMAYGVQPSVEPAVSTGSVGPMPQGALTRLKRGGKYS